MLALKSGAVSEPALNFEKFSFTMSTTVPYWVRFVAARICVCCACAVPLTASDAATRAAIVSDLSMIVYVLL